MGRAKKFPKLFEFRSSYDSPPAPGRAAPVTIELPSGRKIHAEDHDASQLISEALGRKMTLERSATARGERAGIDAATIFADVPIEKVIPGLTAETMPNHFALEKESIFDSPAMHVRASSTLRHTPELAAPGPIFDPGRFRPSIFYNSCD